MLDPLQRAISCVTPVPLIGSGYHPSPQPHSVAFAAPERVVVLRGRRSIRFAVRLDYLIEHAGDERSIWRTVPAGDSYHFAEMSGQELVVFHWHPRGASTITFPHIHVGSAWGSAALDRTHVPTGFVPPQAVVWFAISELGVEPLRDDWDAILSVDDAFRQVRHV